MHFARTYTSSCIIFSANLCPPPNWLPTASPPSDALPPPKEHFYKQLKHRLPIRACGTSSAPLYFQQSGSRRGRVLPAHNVRCGSLVLAIYQMLYSLGAGRRVYKMNARGRRCAEKKPRAVVKRLCGDRREGVQGKVSNEVADEVVEKDVAAHQRIVSWGAG